MISEMIFAPLKFVFRLQIETFYLLILFATFGEISLLVETFKTNHHFRVEAFGFKNLRQRSSHPSEEYLFSAILLILHCFYIQNYHFWLNSLLNNSTFIIF